MLCENLGILKCVKISYCLLLYWYFITFLRFFIDGSINIISLLSGINELCFIYFTLLEPLVRFNANFQMRIMINLLHPHYLHILIFVHICQLIVKDPHPFNVRSEDHSYTTPNVTNYLPGQRRNTGSKKFRGRVIANFSII